MTGKTEGSWKLDIGASLEDGRKTRFRVWAPKARAVTVRVRTSKGFREAPMTGNEKGYFECVMEDTGEGDGYVYVLDTTLERPDPASRFQPEGVHRASAIVDPGSFAWTDGHWRGPGLSGYVIYELHVGTFTDRGTFEGAISRLDYLKDLGVTAVELMPVAQFPGRWNWGYDGVYPYAPQNSYGGPTGLKKLVDACHGKGIAMILDVVYNHLGPEGNYLNDFAPYFTNRYETPWGSAVNFDGPHSDEVRDYFVKNACYWVNEFHADALRIDAIHGIFDFSARHVLQELAEAVHDLAGRLGKKVHIIAESDLNDVRVINRTSRGGYGLDAQWNDDFHHSLHALLTNERQDYYEDFGEIGQMAAAMKEGFVYTGQYSPYRKRSHGNSSKDVPAHRFVQFSQNHDQVGNRPAGDRPGASWDREKLKLAAAAILLSPCIPLLFMGEEYGETAPFLYFVDHSDPSLPALVREGRARQFGLADWPPDLPDPYSEESFLASKIDLDLGRQAGHAEILAYYKEVIGMRRRIRGLRTVTKKGFEARVPDRGNVLVVTRQARGDAVLALLNFSDGDSLVAGSVAQGRWHKILDSASARWGGPGEKAPSVLEKDKKGVVLRSHNAVLYRSVPREAE